jgi:hypothetical protein
MGHMVGNRQLPFPPSKAIANSETFIIAIAIIIIIIIIIIVIVVVLISFVHLFP